MRSSPGPIAALPVIVPFFVNNGELSRRFTVDLNHRFISPRTLRDADLCLYVNGFRLLGAFKNFAVARNTKTVDQRDRRLVID